MQRRTGTRRSIEAGAAIVAALLLSVRPTQAGTEMVDTALVLAVDVSQSVNDYGFAPQMDGIAKAFEDPEVQRSIL